jgi:hypothetical protein
LDTDYDFPLGDQKHYPHFDAPISRRKIRQMLRDFEAGPDRAFYPFFQYEQSWQPYRLETEPKPERKTREIRYGARRDAYVFAFYRRKLARLYEARLGELGIAECPIAYRQVRKGNGGGKCNIDFAKDAVDEIDRLGDCVAVALDIRKYFESLDHRRIKHVWCDLLGVDELPADHYAVFRNITRYRTVNQREVFRRLGFFGPKFVNGQWIDGFLRPYRDVPKKLCSRQEFEEKICGKDPRAGPSLVVVNTKPYGIPQGAPISDLIANFYLIEFDTVMAAYARERGGVYMRYSDDILLILPGGRSEAASAIAFAAHEMRRHGPELQIKEQKTCVALFRRVGDRLSFEHIRQHPDEPNKNGFEYLGFRYDGRRVYVRDSTISGFYRKVATAAKSEAAKLVAANPTSDAAQLIGGFNFSLFSQRFARVKRTNLSDDYRSWTFYTYLKRASRTFGKKGDPILQQARGFPNFVRSRVEEAIATRVAKRRATEPDNMD